MAEISKTTDQALAVLLELSDHGPMTAAALSRSLRLNRTVVHRLLTTLYQRGFVTRQDDGYSPGAIFMRIAERVQPDLQAAAKPVLAKLAADRHETVVLHVPDGSSAVVLDQGIPTDQVVRVEHHIGSRHPLEKGASGRALLAFLSSRSAERLIRGSESEERLRRELDGIRSLGYATSHDELQDGVHGLAVPILDSEGRAVASLAVLVPTNRAGTLIGHLDALRAAADEISARLGGANGAGAGRVSTKR